VEESETRGKGRSAGGRRPEVFRSVCAKSRAGSGEWRPHQASGRNGIRARYRAGGARARGPPVAGRLRTGHHGGYRRSSLPRWPRSIAGGTANRLVVLRKLETRFAAPCACAVNSMSEEPMAGRAAPTSTRSKRNGTARRSRLQACSPSGLKVEPPLTATTRGQLLTRPQPSNREAPRCSRPDRHRQPEQPAISVHFA